MGLLQKRLTDIERQFENAAIVRVLSPLYRSLPEDPLNEKSNMEDFGYSPIQLRAAFDYVSNKKNWKLPIDARIPVFLLDIVNAAVVFYTGSEITELARNGDQLMITAPGYYASIGS